jgi:hypothetical protein
MEASYGEFEPPSAVDIVGFAADNPVVDRFYSDLQGTSSNGAHNG